MNFNVLQRQSFAAMILRAHLEKNRLSSTYLFTGSEGGGKEDLALVFAASLLCSEGKILEACECSNCRKADQASHPDLHLIGHDTKVKSIKIDEVRDVLGLAALKPYEAARKIFLIYGADRLTPEASNAFLKTLEEPSEGTVFVLMAENKTNLMETIQSRCFEIRLKPDASDWEKDLIPPGIGQGRWIDALESYSDVPRPEFARQLDGLLNYFRNVCKTSEDSEASCRALKASECVLEVKDALDHNVNQKLAVSRLQMHLERLIPVR